MIHVRSVRPTDVPAESSTVEPAERSRHSLLGRGAGLMLRGTGGLGLLLARGGFLLARSGVRSLRANDRQATSAPAAAGPERRSGRRGSRLRLAVGAGLLAAVAGGTAAVLRNRRRAVPEPAPEPPRLTPSLNGSAPHTPASAPAAP